MGTGFYFNSKNGGFVIVVSCCLQHIYFSVKSIQQVILKSDYKILLLYFFFFNTVCLNVQFPYILSVIFFYLFIIIIIF